MDRTCCTRPCLRGASSRCACRCPSSPRFSRGIGSGGVRVLDGEVHYLVNRAAVSLLRPRQPTDGVPVPVLATPAVAALGDVISLRVNDAPLTVRVVGTTRFVPS